MFISGRHCEIRYEKGGYWLYDFSRNGTFVNGSRQRVKNPHRLLDGDRIQIGHYFVTVSIDEAEDASAGDDPFPPPAPSASADDIWDTGAPSPPPISRRDLMPPQRKGKRSADFAEQFLEMPPIRPVPGAGHGPCATTAAGRRPFRGGSPRTGIAVRRGWPAAKPIFGRCAAAARAGQPAVSDARRRVRAPCPADPGTAACGTAVRGPVCIRPGASQRWRCRRHPACDRDRGRRFARHLPAAACR